MPNRVNLSLAFTFFLLHLFYFLIYILTSVMNIYNIKVHDKNEDDFLNEFLIKLKREISRKFSI